jgi:outer membrane protein
MKKQLSSGVLAAMLGTATALTAVPAAAYNAGDMVLRAGLAGVLPTGDGTLPGDPPATVEADDGYSLGITGTWMATNNIGVGLLVAWPFTHEVELNGAVEIAEVEHLPPTLTLQYHFDTPGNLHPYVGAGVNYTNFIEVDENPNVFGPGESLDLDDSWGLALEAGVDMELQNNWTVGAAVWWIDIDTDATLTTIGEGPETTALEVEIDPWVFMLSVGKKF